MHNYFATCPVSSESYRSGVRAYAPIEIKWDTEKLLRSGCLLFTTRSEGVLCREPCAPSAIISIIDTVKEEVLYSLHIDDAPEVPSGSAGSTLPTRKRQLLARESLSAYPQRMRQWQSQMMSTWKWRLSGMRPWMQPRAKCHSQGLRRLRT